MYVPYEERIDTYLVPLVFIVIFLLGTVGNGTLVFVFIRHRGIRTVPNIYIFRYSQPIALCFFVSFSLWLPSFFAGCRVPPGRGARGRASERSEAVRPLSPSSFGREGGRRLSYLWAAQCCRQTGRPHRATALGVRTTNIVPAG